MKITIREEKKSDFMRIYNLVEAAFKKAEHSDGNEQDLILKLRKSDNYINELALVAEFEEEIIAHIMMTKMYIVNKGQKVESLVLAPVAVANRYQGNKVGTKLIEECIKKARILGFGSICVLGDNKYYERFGFKEARNFGIKAPFDVPSKYFMMLELKENSLEGIQGVVEYSKEFFEV